MSRCWHREDAALFRRLPDGVLLMALHEGDPVFITSPGDAVWDALDEPSTAAGIAAKIASTMAPSDIGAAEVRRDVDVLLHELDRRGLISGQTPTRT